MAMALNVDMRTIVHAEVIPWEVDRDQYGVAYETSDGRKGASKIGTKAEAESVLRAFQKQGRR